MVLINVKLSQFLGAYRNIGYILSGKMFVLARITDFVPFNFVLSSHFVHVALRECLFCLENIRSTRNENEIELRQNIPAIQ